MKRSLCSLVLVLAGTLVAAACSGDSSSSGVITQAGPTITDTDTGTVPIPVGGAFQSDTKVFTTTQSGTVSVVLTSAIETLPGGTLLPNVVMGLAIGTFANATCAPLPGGTAQASASSAVVLQGTLSAGTYCVMVSDVTNQLGPVAYTILVTHPQ
jgi:hypothetical protein